MKIILTGGSGMVGHHILAHPLAQCGDINIDAPPRTRMDLRDKRAVADYFRREQPDLVIHAAGKVGGIRANMADLYGFLLENIEIGANVIDAAREAGVERLINLGSSCIYPRNVDGLLTENLLLKGELEPTNEGYALAKLAALKLCEFASCAGRAFKTLIPCNLYGPHDHFELESCHLMPAIIRKVHEARVQGRPTVEIWGDGSARREFMYAGDLADAVLQVASRFDSAPALMNAGPGHDHTVLEYYRIVAKVIGWHGDFTFDLSQPTGMRRKLLDISRQTTWGWHPSTSLEDGIRATYEFFLRNEKSS